MKWSNNDLSNYMGYRANEVPLIDIQKGQIITYGIHTGETAESSINWFEGQVLDVQPYFIRVFRRVDGKNYWIDCINKVDLICGHTVIKKYKHGLSLHAF